MSAFPTEVTFNKIPTLHIVQVHLIVACVFVGIAVLVVALRFVVRIKKGAKLWWDDWLCLAALPQGIGMLIIQGLYSKLGVGYPVTETILNMPLILRLLVAYELIYSTCISTIKISMLLFYLRVFVNDGLRRATKYALYFVIAWSTANILQVFLICRPFRMTYDPTAGGKCGDQVASFIAIGAFNAITDVLILSLPMRTVWTLQMKPAAKFGITGVFLVGLIVSVIALVRIASLTTLDLNNLTGTMIYAVFWSSLEPNMGIICVCLPMLGPLWSSCAVRFKTTPEPSGPSAGSYQQNSKSSKAFNRLHDHEMDTMYTRTDEVYAGDAGKSSAGAREGSLSGSETALSPEPLPRHKPLQVA